MQGNALSLLAVPRNSTFLKYILMADVRCQLLAQQAHPSGCPAAAACAGEVHTHRASQLHFGRWNTTHQRRIIPCFKETIHLKGSAALLRVWEGEGLFVQLLHDVLVILVTCSGPTQAGLDSRYPVVFILTVRTLRRECRVESASFHSKKIIQHLCLLSHCCDFQ